jgi:hypothetical protein
VATIKWYLVNAADANGWQQLSETAQIPTTSNSGWVVGTGATLNSELQALNERASTTFVGSTVPDGTLDTTLKDAFRTPILTGTFASGNWTFTFAVQSPTQGGAADGQIVFRLIKANADGSGATEITSAQQSASVCTNVSTSDVNGTLTFNPGAITFTSQYLFIQVAWKRTGAGGMTTTNIRLRAGTASTGTTVLSSDFTPGNQAVTGVMIASTTVVRVPIVVNTQLVTGNTILSTVLLCEPSVALTWYQKIYDQFMGTSGTDLTAHAPDAGGTWVNEFNTGTTLLQIAASGTGASASNTVSGSGAIYHNTTTLGPTQAAQVVVQQGNSGAGKRLGLFLRRTPGALNSYLLQIADGTIVRIYRQTGGAFTQLQSLNSTFVPGDVLRFEAIGSSLVGYKNGVSVVSATDTTYTTGISGLYADVGTTLLEVFDSFRAYDDVEPPQPSLATIASTAVLYAPLVGDLPPSADITLVASAKASGNDGSFITGLNMTGADLIVLIAVRYISGPAYNVSDSESNTYVGGTIQNNDAAAVQVKAFYAWNPTVSASMNFSHPGTDNYSTLIVLGFAGVDRTADPLIAQSGLSNYSGSDVPVAVGTIATLDAGDLLVTGLGQYIGSPPSWVSVTLPTSTIAQSDIGVAGTSFGASAAYRVNATGSAMTSLTPTWTPQPTYGAAIAGTVLTFRAAVGIPIEGIAGAFIASGLVVRAPIVALATGGGGGGQVEYDFSTKPDANPLPDPPWQSINGALKNLSGQSTPVAFGGIQAMRWNPSVNAFDQDQFIEIKIGAGSATAGYNQFIFLRGSGTDYASFYGLVLYWGDGWGGSITIGRIDSGNFVVLQTTGASVAVGNWLRLEVEGTTLRAYKKVGAGAFTQIGTDQSSSSVAYTGQPGHGGHYTAYDNADYIRLGNLSVEIVAQNITGALIGSTAQLFAPTVPVYTGNAFEPSAFGPAFVPQIDAIAQAFIPSTNLLYAHTVTTGPVTVTGATRPTTIQLYAPTIASGPVTVTGAHRPSTVQMFAASIGVGAISIATGIRASTVQLFALTVAAGAITIGGSTVAATGARYAPTVAPGTVTVLLPTIGATSQTFAPRTAPHVAGATIGVTSGAFPPSTALSVTTGTRPLTSVVNAPSLTPGVATVTASHCPTAIAVYPPAVAVGVATIIGGTRPSTSQVYAPFVIPLVSGATIGSSSGVFPLSVALNVTTATRATTQQVFAPFVAVGAATVTMPVWVKSTQLFDPTVLLAGVLGVPNIGSTLQRFAPTITTGAITIGGPTRPSAINCNPPLITTLASVGGVYRSTTAQIFPPALVGAGSLITGIISSSLQIFAPFISRLISGITVSTTTQVYPPSVSLRVITATIPSTSQRFAPSVSPLTFITGVRIVSTVQVYPPTVTLFVSGITISSTAQLFAPSISVTVQVVPVASTTQIFAPAIRTGFIAGFIDSTDVLYPPTVEPEIGIIIVGGIQPTTRVFPPSVGRVLPPTTCLVSGIRVRYLAASVTIGTEMAVTSASLRVTQLSLPVHPPSVPMLGYDLKTRVLVTSDGLHVCCLETVHD